MKLCKKTCHWEYLFTQKETRQKKLDEGFEWIKPGEDAERQQGLCQEKGRGFYANHVEEVAGKTEVMNVFEYEYERKDKEGKKESLCFGWVTSLEVTKRNLEEMKLAGRGRWKGFNNQKKGLYRIEHLNSKNSNAKKPLSVDADSRYPDAALCSMESIYKRVEPDTKKYIFGVTGKF